MSKSVQRRWRRDVSDGSARDALIIDVELRLDDGGALATWSLVARLERGGGKPLIREGLDPRAALSLRHAFDNHILLSGDVHLVTTEELFLVWAKLQYGFDKDPPHYFDGSIGELRRAPSPVPDRDRDPDPDPDPDLGPDPDPGRPDVLDPSLPIVVQAGEDGDLFPYTYMRSWPDPDAAQLALRFTCYPYPLDAAPTGQLLRQLAVLRQRGGPDARGAMQALAIRYLDGELGDEAPLLDRVDGLAGPIAAYPRVFALLAARGRRAPAELQAELWQLLGMSAAETAAFLQSASHQRDVARLWQSYLALIVELGFDRRGRVRLTQALIVEHALGWLTAQLAPAPAFVPEPAQLAALIAAVPVLPEAIFPLPPAQGSPPLESPPRPGGGEAGTIVPYAIGDLLMVKHVRRGYALGELAYVESLRAGERRETTRRQFDRVVEAAVEARTDEDAQQSAARTASSSLTSEALGTLADTITTTTYNDFGTSYGPPTTATLTGGWSVEQKPAGAPSKEDLTRFAREVLSKTLHRIAHRVAEVRSRSAQRDSEETVTSVVDNSRGLCNRRAVYRWLDEVHGARVVNYGNRLLVELIIEAPATHLLHGERAPRAGEQPPPLPPAALGIESFEDIGPHNFAALIARYPSDAAALPPPARRVVSASLRSGEAISVELPEGYEATGATLGYALGAAPVELQGVIGGQAFQLSAAGAGTTQLTLAQPAGAVQVTVQGIASVASPPEAMHADAGGPRFTLEITAALGARALDEWRLRTFQAIQRSYAAQRQAYERARAPEAMEAGAGAAALAGPRSSARAVERRELRHGAIELLLARQRQLLGGAERPESGQMVPELELARPRTLRFFDAAFEWREMTYSFLSAREAGASPSSPPVGPASPGAAAALATRLGGDARFVEFLEASYARLLVPVTWGHAQAVLYFLSSGALWDVPELATALPGGHVAAHAGDVALVHELLVAAHQAHAPSEPRLVRVLPSIRVPTSIAVLSDGELPLLAERAELAEDAS